MNIENNKIIINNEHKILFDNSLLGEVDVTLIPESLLDKILMNAINNAKKDSNQFCQVEITIWHDSYQRENGLGITVDFFDYFGEEIKENQEECPDEPFYVVSALESVPDDYKRGCAEIWIDKSPIFHAERGEYFLYKDILNYLDKE